MKKKKLITLISALTAGALLLSSCGNNTAQNNPAPGGDSQNPSVPQQDGASYTYTFASLETPTTWNSHEAQIVESITAYTEMSLWLLCLNDAADGYELVPEMAEGEPEDVTAEYAGDEKWGVPADATEGYAWRVSLNPNAKWEDGTPINADSYVYSMQQLLNPEMHNYSASGYYTTLPVYHAENYYKSASGGGMSAVVDGESFEFDDYGDADLCISFTQPSSPFYSGGTPYSAADYYNGYEDYFVNEAGEDLYEKYGSEDYVPVTDEVIEDINYMLAQWWGNDDIDEDNYLYMAFYEKELEPVTFDDVGFFKTGDYELTVILYSPLSSFYFKYNSADFALVNEEKYEAGKTQAGDMIKTNYGTSAETYMSYGPYKLVSFQPDKEWRATKNENWYGWTDGKHEGMYQATDIVCTIVEDRTTQELLFLQGKLDYLSLTAENLATYEGSDYIVYFPSDYIYFLNINNDYDSLSSREEDGVNKTILTYLDFRKGISLAINRSEFVAQQGFGKPLYGYVSDYYTYDPETGVRYRDADVADETLKAFYGISDTDEITGYDLETARACLVSAYEQALADGVVSEADRFVFDYPTWTNETFYEKEVNFLQNALDAAVQGTALEGRITVNMVVNEDYYAALDAGEYDICNSGWNGNAFDPYELLQFFTTDMVSPQAYLGFDPETETLDIEVDGSVVTHTYYDWYDTLCNGEYAIAEPDVKNTILAAVELSLLQKYRDCPFWSNTSSALDSRKVSFPTDEPVLEVLMGGIRRMTFNYSDEEWEAYCAENNYQLNYQ